jgi:transmembrane sensor
MIGSVEPDRLEEAARWRTRLAEAHGRYIHELEAWLAQDPRNREAWQFVQTPWEFLGEHATSPGLIRLRRAALAHAHNAGQDQWTWWRHFRFPATLGTAAAVLLLAVASFLIWQMHRFDVYSTRAGERRVVTLTDGSQIALDSQSEVRVRYSAHARELTLASGQARFDVAHDVERPFSVTAVGHKVVATGTAFNVDLLGSDLLVTLIEGHVVVVPQKLETRSFESSSPVPASGDSSPPVTTAGETTDRRFSSRIVLDAGEQLVISPRAAPSVTRVNVDRATAWQNGQLVFDNERLSTVVARVSRYGQRPIVIGDEPTAGLRISGVFHEGDVDGFVSTIVRYLPVSAQRARDGSIRISSREPEERSVID